MKTIILLLAAFSISYTVKAQQKKDLANEGFWVVESNIQHNKKHVVKFYTASSQLLYEYKLENKKLNIEKPGIQKLLNAKLASLLKNNRR